MFDSENDLDTIYLEGGPLAGTISNYIYREPQLQFAKKVMDTIAHKKILLAEAGTGTGKTLAYLIPAILSPGTFIISTGTKNLQNQLYFRDLPLVQKALKMPVSIALLKGRSNYLCKYRLELAMTDILLSSSEMVSQFKRIVSWAEATNDGDISTLFDIPEDASVWMHVTSTHDNCLAQECPLINSCFVYKARAVALEAKIIVINHHLLFSDWSIRAEHLDARLLPNNVNLIIDEAHQIAQTATMYFGTLFSSKKAKAFLQDIQHEQKTHATDVKEIAEKIRASNFLLDELQHYLSTKPERGFFSGIFKDDYFKSSLNTLADTLKQLENVLQQNAARSSGLESCWERAIQLSSDLQVFILADAANSNGNNSNIFWYEIYKQSFIFKKSPLEIKQLFFDNLQETTRSCVLTSATVSVDGDFDLVQSTLGLESAETLRITSPFHYRQQSMLYIPRGMPDPMADNYTDCLVEQIMPVLDYSKGRAFVLFTSFNGMQNAYEKLLTRLSAEQPYNILIQGKESKSSLLERFIAEENSVLFATASFWEGVDVKGPDLHCVIIDKLPFASPSDPLLQAKINHIKSQGRNPFLELQCHQAVLHLIQGAGRLIRSESDYGVLMICDPRILSRPYGKLFLNSLPDMQRTREITKIKDFYEQFESTI